MKVSTPTRVQSSTSWKRLSSGAWSSTPMRHLTVAGMETASPMAAMHSATSSGSRIRQAPKRGLHPVRRTADVEVDLVVAEVLPDARGGGEIGGVGAAELQRHRVLGGIEPEQPLPVAV